MLWRKNNNITYRVFSHWLLLFFSSTLFWKTAQMFATSWKWTWSLSWKLGKYIQLAKVWNFCYICYIKMYLSILWNLINIGKAFDILGRNKLQLIFMCEFTTQKAWQFSLWKQLLKVLDESTLAENICIVWPALLFIETRWLQVHPKSLSSLT